MDELKPLTLKGLAAEVSRQEIKRIFSGCEVEGNKVVLTGRIACCIRDLCLEAIDQSQPTVERAELVTWRVLPMRYGVANPDWKFKIELSK